IINLDEPKGQIDTFILGNNLTINWTVSDTNLESCYFTYNNINTSVTCSANNFSFIPVSNVQNLTFYANDSFGNENSNFTSWEYQVLENNIIYNNITLETASETFILNITTAGLQVPSIPYLLNQIMNMDYPLLAVL
ncbi:unnamed protein product, partial [marine sediment metagenome]